MKKRILSLVLCAAMLLSMCLFLGAGVAEDTTAEGSAETTESYIPAVNFTNVAPFVQANAQAANGPARAPMFAANANGGSTTPTDPSRKISDAVVTEKTATKNADGTYTIKLTSYTTGTVKQQTTTKPTDIVLVLDQSGSMKDAMGSEQVTVYTKVEGRNSTNYYNYYYQANRYVKLSNGAYAPVTITESKSGGWFDTTYTYTYTYTDENGQQQSITSEGYDTTFGSWQLYSKETRVLTRLEALKNAVTNFVDQVSKEATESKVDHRIAIVGFSSDGRNNTEILTGCKINGMNGVQFSKATEDDYQKALVTMNTTDGKTSAENAIAALTANGGTETNKGMVMAENIFENDTKKGADRNRVVVLFTDGVPGLHSGDETEEINTNYANPAIKCANNISKNYSATIYTVGIFSGANGENPKMLPDNGEWYTYDDHNVVPSSSTANRFMHLVSSNYPDATAMNNAGNVNSSLKNGDSYYLSAGDADTLNNIFEKIGDNISKPSINLGSKAEVRDIVSPYFNAPENAEDITVYAEKATPDGSDGYNWVKDTAYTDSAKMKAEVNGQAVTVSGFDYDANFVSETGRDEVNPKKNGSFYGRRLVVEFNVTVKPEFLGGNGVPTNLPTSGVYDENEKVVENFEYPRVDIPVRAPELTGETKNIYYNGTQLKPEDLCTPNISTNMDDYVDLSYSADKKISNTEDDKYTVTVTATPKYPIAGEEQKSASAEAKATVTVFKPEVTYQDCTTDYGVAPQYQAANFVSAVWKNSQGESADDVSMTGEEPTLTYEYSPAKDKFTEDTYVKVTVSANGTELPKGVVTFKHNGCTFSGCSFDPEQGQFIVHINVFDLTIKKTGEKIDQHQTFVFRVKGEGVDMQVVITGTNKQVIKNLPVGDYTITEDTNWSWKYTPVGDATQKLKAGRIHDGVATVTFENENKGTNWLTSLADVINKWLSADDVKQFPGKN